MKTLQQHISEKLVINKNFKNECDLDTFIDKIKNNGLNVKNFDTFKIFQIYPTEKDGVKIEFNGVPKPNIKLKMCGENCFYTINNSNHEYISVYDINNKQHILYMSNLDIGEIKIISNNVKVQTILYTEHNANIISEFLLNIAKTQK